MRNQRPNAFIVSLVMIPLFSCNAPDGGAGATSSGAGSASTTSGALSAKISLIASSVGFAGVPNLVVDSKGNVYYPNTNESFIGKISPTGAQTVFAGSASLVAPSSIVDGLGAAATFGRPYALAIDSTDTIYVLDYGYTFIRKITPNGNVTTTAAPLNGLECLGFAVDPSGNFYCSETNPGGWTSANLITKITPAGAASTLAGSGSAGDVNGSGGSASFNNPRNLASDSFGNIYVADIGNFLIRKITPAGNVTTFAGSGAQRNEDGVGTAASFYFYQNLGWMTIDGSGNLYVGDADGATGYIRRISPSGAVNTICGNGSTSQINQGYCDNSGVWVNEGIAVSSSGVIYFGAASQLFSISSANE